MVETFGYEARVTVSYDPERGTILSVTDHGTEAGSNASFWKQATTLFEKLKGKTAKEIDSVDAITGATLSSNAIKEAVKAALSKAAGTVSPPKATAADLRTHLLYAATETAALQITAPEGAEVFYTIDGSDPKESKAQKVEQGTLTVSAQKGNADDTAVVKLAAKKGESWSEVTEVPVSFVKIPEADSGTKVYLGQAVCKGGAGEPYTVKVKVTTVNGRIALLEDHETEITADADYAFWFGWNVMGEDGMPARLKGKNLLELLHAKTTPSDRDEDKADAVSGATVSSDAIRYAVIDALRSRPITEGMGELTPPVLQASREVAANLGFSTISVVMTGEKDAVIRYTLDGSEPTESSQEISSLPPFKEDFGVLLKPDLDGYADGRIIVLKAAAFQNGKRSDTVTGRYVFANANSRNTYQSGTTTATAEGITAKVTVESPNFDQKYYITKIQLDDASQQAYRAFLPELLSQVYLKQGTTGVAEISGKEADSRKVLAAIDAALKESIRAAEPVITVTPERRDYANDAEVQLSIACATADAEIYYVVDDSKSLTGSRLSDFEKNKQLYTGPVSLKMTHPEGGNLYIRAAAKTGENNWSPYARKDLTFVKAVGKDALLVNGTGYGTWAEAVSAIEQTGGGEILLKEDLELRNEDVLPSVTCTIRSEDGKQHKIKGGIKEAKGDITFDHLIFDINRIYANGHSVTIGSEVKTGWSFTRRSIYGGPAYDAAETDITANPVISVSSGEFALYAGGGGKTTLRGNVRIDVKGTADADVCGAGMNSTVEGTVSVSVEETATLHEFMGEQRDGHVTDLLLHITGGPTLSGRTYRGTVNGTPKGTLDLEQAALSAEQVKKFKDFAAVKTARTEAATEEVNPEATASDEERETPTHSVSAPTETNGEERDAAHEETLEDADIS